MTTAELTVESVAAAMAAEVVYQQEKAGPKFVDELKRALAEGRDDLVDRLLRKSWTHLVEHATARTGFGLATTEISHSEGRILSRPQLRAAIIAQLRARLGG